MRFTRSTVKIGFVTAGPIRVSNIEGSVRLQLLSEKISDGGINLNLHKNNKIISSLRKEKAGRSSPNFHINFASGAIPSHYTQWYSLFICIPRYITRSRPKHALGPVKLCDLWYKCFKQRRVIPAKAIFSKPSSRSSILIFLSSSNVEKFLRSEVKVCTVEWITLLRSQLVYFLITLKLLTDEIVQDKMRPWNRLRLPSFRAEERYAHIVRIEHKRRRKSEIFVKHRGLASQNFGSESILKLFLKLSTENV